jgi:hypothetical protein
VETWTKIYFNGACRLKNIFKKMLSVVVIVFGFCSYFPIFAGSHVEKFCICNNITDSSGIERLKKLYDEFQVCSANGYFGFYKDFFRFQDDFWLDEQRAAISAVLRCVTTAIRIIGDDTTVLASFFKVDEQFIEKHLAAQRQRDYEFEEHFKYSTYRRF